MSAGFGWLAVPGGPRDLARAAGRRGWEPGGILVGSGGCSPRAALLVGLAEAAPPRPPRLALPSHATPSARLPALPRQVRFAHKEKVVLMADEVYQPNIYQVGWT